MKDFRCNQCNRLLAKIDGSAKVEIKCPRCKTLNLFSEEIYITIETSTKTIDLSSKKDEQCTDPAVAES